MADSKNWNENLKSRAFFHLRYMSESKFINPFRRLSKEEAMLPAVEQKYKGMVQNKMKMYKIGLSLDEIGLLQILIAHTPEDSLTIVIAPKDLVEDCQIKYETLRKKLDSLIAHNCVKFRLVSAEGDNTVKGRRWEITVNPEDQWSAEVKEAKEMTSEDFLKSQEDK